MPGTPFIQPNYQKIASDRRAAQKTAANAPPPSVAGKVSPQAIDDFPDSKVAQDSATSAAGQDPSAVGQINAIVNTRTNRVYFGQVLDESEGRSGGKRSAYDDVRSLKTAENDIYTWSDSEREAFGQQLFNLGIIKNAQDYGAIFTTWKAAVDEAAKYYQAGKKMTPWDVIQIKGFNVAGTGGSGSANANATITRTAKDTNYIDGATADAYTRSIFQNTVGRDPTDGELSRYRTLIVGYQKGHPTITQTTTKYDSNGDPINENSTTQQNADATGLQDVMMQQAKKDPEYGSYQAATTYYNQLMQLINGTG